MPDCTLSQKVQDALNSQINGKLACSYVYLHMSSYCNSRDFPGFGTWLRKRSEEDYAHAMKLYDFLQDYDGKVVMKGIQAPKMEYTSLHDVFDHALDQEQSTTQQIHVLYELAQAERAYALQAQLQWFLTEQVNEEKEVRDLIARLEFVHGSSAGMLQLDIELGGRVGVSEDPAPAV